MYVSSHKPSESRNAQPQISNPISSSLETSGLSIYVKYTRDWGETQSVIMSEKISTYTRFVSNIVIEKQLIQLWNNKETCLH